MMNCIEEALKLALNGQKEYRDDMMFSYLLGGKQDYRELSPHKSLVMFLAEHVVTAYSSSSLFLRDVHVEVYMQKH